MSTIGERIALIIKEKRITKLKFAADVGISSGNVTMLCQDKVRPSSPTIKSICRAYNVNETWLTTGSGEMFNVSTEVEELAFLMGVVLNDDRTPFRRKLLKTILELPPEDIDKIEAYVRKLLEEEVTETDRRNENVTC